jgi:hypothetical protein
MGLKSLESSINGKAERYRAQFMAPPYYRRPPRSSEACFVSRLGVTGAFFLAVLIVGCQLIPTKPDALFVLYRDRMKSDNVAEARSLLSDESRELALKLTAEHGLRQPPENLALLNVLDPVASPTVVSSDDRSATLHVRTLRGGLRSVQVVRKDANAQWKIDITGDLKALQTFLQARGALDMIREQAGEYAASLKEFNSQLERMDVSEPVTTASPPKPTPAKKIVKKPAAKTPVKQKKQID